MSIGHSFKQQLCQVRPHQIIAGVLFVIEEASSWMRPKLLWRCFFGNAVVHITLRALRSWCEDGGCGKFGKGGFIIFNIKVTSVLLGNEGYI